MFVAKTEHNIGLEGLEEIRKPVWKFDALPRPYLFESTRLCRGEANSDLQSSSAHSQGPVLFVFCFFFPRPQCPSNSSQEDSIKAWQSLALTQPHKVSLVFTCLLSTVTKNGRANFNHVMRNLTAKSSGGDKASQTLRSLRMH